MAFDVLRQIIGSPEFTTMLLTAFGTIVVAFVGWVGVVIRRYVLHSLSDRDLALLRNIATIVVQYVDQVYTDLDGPAKLDEAMRAADAYLIAYGLHVSTDQLRAVIEAAVRTELAHATFPSTPPHLLKVA